MWKTNRYSIYIKSNFALQEFPLRLLNFKRQKWLPLQKRLKRLLKPRGWKKKKRGNFTKPSQVHLINPILVHSPQSRWVRNPRSYANELISKRLFYILYQRGITPKFLKQQIKKGFDLPLRFIKLLVKPYYRIDILSKFLNFYSSVKEATQMIARGKLLVNKVVVKTLVFLDSGDILQLKDNSATAGIFLAVLRKRHSKKKKLLSFILVDYYTKSVIIIKKPTDLVVNELSTMAEPKLNFRSFHHLF